MATNPPSPQRRSWKDAAGSPAQPAAGAKRDWHHPGKPDAGKKPMSRNAKAAILGTGIVVLVAAFLVVILWPSKPPPVRLVLLTAGYETSLAVPHNVAGRNASKELERWAEEYKKQLGGGDKKFGIEVVRHDLSGKIEPQGNPLADALKDCESETVIVFLAAHGGADEQGPFFLRDDHDLTAKQTYYRLRDVVDAFRKLPEKTHKLLIVDATQVPSHWSSGQLHNDFARKVKESEDLLQQVPNLLVFCSTDEDQRSWVANEWSRTAFAHYLLEGLGGAADRRPSGDTNGRVDANELIAYVKEKTEFWARHNREARQTPIELGAKDFAASFELVIAREGNELALPEPPRDSFAEVEKAWAECEELYRSEPAPAIYTPLLWKRYLDSALRFEQLTRAGDRDNAGIMRKEMSDLRERIGQAGALQRRSSAALTLAMPAAFGVVPTAGEVAALRKFDADWTWGESAEDFRKRVDAVDKAAESDWRRPLVYVGAEGTVLTKLRESPARLAEACRSLSAMDVGPLNLRPAEAHFAAMLYPLASKDGKSRVAALLAANKSELLGRAVQLRLQAEAAALGLGLETEGEKTSLPAFSEQVQPWVRPLLHRADRKRRLAHDFLFANDKDVWARAEDRADKTPGLIGDAETLYRQAQETAIGLRRALRVQYVVMAELPFYHRSEAGSEDKLEKAWKQVHALIRLTATPPAPEARVARLQEMDKAAGEAWAALDALRKDFQLASERRHTDTQRSWHEIEQLLEVPFGCKELTRQARVALVRRSQEISYALNAATKNATPQSITKEQSAAAARASAVRQAKVALAAFGGEHLPDFDKVSGNLLRAKERPDWQPTLVEAGGRVRAGLEQLLTRVTALSTTAFAAMEKSGPELAEAARKARFLEGAVTQGKAPLLASDPVTDLRRLQLHDLLCWQAERTFRDFWAAEEPGRTPLPYYCAAGLAFLKDAEEMIAPGDVELSGEQKARRLARIEALRAKLNDDKLRVTMQWQRGPEFVSTAGDLPLTDEAFVERRYRFVAADGVPWVADKDEEVSPGDDKEEGAPVIWVEQGPGLVPREGEDRPHPRRGFNSVEKFTLVPKPVATRLLSEDTVKHTVRGLFRGHESEAATQVRFYRYPDLSLRMPPPPPAGRVAIQSGIIDGSSTALVIVLDLSGSMLFDLKDGTKDQRYDRVRAALLGVMKEVPDGTTVSLRAFGGFGNEQPVTRLVWDKRRWKAEDIVVLRRMLDDYETNKQITGGTPLIKGLVEAVNDLPPNFPGYQTIVALTDGVDSEFDGARIPAALRKAYQDTNIALTVVGFDIGQLDKKKEQDALAATKAGITAVGGAFEDVKGSGDLARTLGEAMRRMRYRIEADKERAAPGEVPKEPINITRSDDREAWRWSPSLNSGPYLINVRATRTLQDQPVRVNPGDSLLLEMLTVKNRLALRRAIYADTRQIRADQKVFGREEAVTPDGKKWVMAVMENRPTNAGLSLMTTLEKDEGLPDPAARVRLQQVRPRLVWFQLQTPEKGAKGPRLEVEPLPQYPAPAFELLSPDWPGRTPPAMNVWWSEDLVRLARTLRIGSDFTAVSELENKTFDNVWRLYEKKAETVTVESVKFEKRAVSNNAGAPKDVGCMVVRLRYPPNTDPFFVLPPEGAAGEWHRFYQDAGKYTGVFWNVSESEVRDLKELHLISAAELKEKGLKVTNLPLGAPDDFKRPAVN